MSSYLRPRGDFLMNEFHKMMLDRSKYLQNLIHVKTQELKSAPEGVLRANPRKNTVEFYLRTAETNPNGKYLSKKSEKKLIHALAQKEYNKRIIKASENEEKFLNKLISLYEQNETVENQFNRMPEAKQGEIIPVFLPDRMFVEKWEEKTYDGLDFTEQTPEYYSDKNERMRSKSEVIIGNLLNKHQIPYRYECPLDLGGKTVYPDFTIMNVRLRKEMYWEHLGLLEDPDYQEKNIAKILRYETYGYFPGDRLIITMETSKQPLNMKLILQVIKKYCI